MDLLARWITETEELEEALEGTLDTDERLAEYADAVSRVRDEAVRYRNAYRGAVEALHEWLAAHDEDERDCTYTSEARLVAAIAAARSIVGGQ